GDDALGLLPAGQILGRNPVAGEGLERARGLVLILNIGGIALLDLVDAEAWRGVPELNEPVGLAVGKWPQKDRVDDAERGCRAGDAKPERENGDGREARRAGETTQRR